MLKLFVFEVAPFAGAWIEIFFEPKSSYGEQLSLPSRERGLKIFFIVNIKLDRGYFSRMNAYGVVWKDRAKNYIRSRLKGRDTSTSITVFRKRR